MLDYWYTLPFQTIVRLLLDKINFHGEAHVMAFHPISKHTKVVKNVARYVGCN